MRKLKQKWSRKNQKRTFGVELNNPHEKGGVDFGSYVDLLPGRKSGPGLFEYLKHSDMYTHDFSTNGTELMTTYLQDLFSNNNKTINDRNIVIHTGSGGFNLFNQLIEENVSNTSIVHK